LWPYTGFFPQISHIFAMTESSFQIQAIFYTFLPTKAILESGSCLLVDRPARQGLDHS
jgi:hypothetical protein